jgi:hypothetical protein
MWDTIEHLADPAAYLEAAFRLLDPGGWLFLTTGDVGAMVARLRGRRWRQIHPSTHLHYFSRATMTRLLTRIGFSRPRFKTAGNVHTVDSIFYNLKLRRHPLGRLSDVAWVNRTFGSIEITINLGDTMLVAARKPQEPHRSGRDHTR